MLEQSALQPSPPTRFPSSQISFGSSTPLPHLPHGCPGTGHTQPASSVQVVLQPSPPEARHFPPGHCVSRAQAAPALLPPEHLPPSSQASLVSLTPLPQRSHGAP